MVTSVVRLMAVATALAGAVALGDTTALAPMPVVPGLIPSDPAAAAHTAQAEARYRIGGKVRLVLFWVSRDDVGSARLTWTEGYGRRSVSLLAGSNPERAPNRLNQWIYLREESGDDRSDVIAIRSVTDAESAASPTDAALDGPLFSASCAAIHPTVVDTSVTTVTAGPGLTYRAIDQLLDTLATSSNWTGQRIARPPGAEVGFLTTLSTLMAASPGAAQKPAAVVRPMRHYIYNNVVYDLTMLRTEVGESAKVGTAVFPVLWRSDFAVRNRTTGRVTRFAATYVPHQQGVVRPVQIIYQPNWWLKVELRLDDLVEAPPDPGRDADTLRRIHDLCAVSAE